MNERDALLWIEQQIRYHEAQAHYHQEQAAKLCKDHAAACLTNPASTALGPLPGESMQWCDRTWAPLKDGMDKP
jgi:hypothetical protein